MKKILIISTILVVVLVAGAIIYWKWRHNFIRNEVPQLVFLKSDSLYTIAYGDVYIDEVNGEVIIEDIYLRPDTTHRKDKSNPFPRNMMEVSIPSLHMTGLHTDQAVIQEELIARKLRLSRPIVTLYRNLGSDKEEKERHEENTKSVSTTNDIYKVILRSLLRIKIDSIFIDSARYNMVTWKDRDTLLTGSYVNLALFGLDISDSTAGDTSRVLFGTKALLTIDDLKITNDAGMYNYRVSSVDLNSELKTFTAKRISVVPLYNEAEFMRLMGEQGDRFDIDFNGASFSNIDAEQILDGSMVADNLTIKEGIFKIYRDKNYTRKKVNRIGKFPHQLLLKSSMTIALKKIDIQSGYLEYKEKSNLTGNMGKIRFNDMALSISNLSNRTNDLVENPLCLVNLRAQFLNVVPVNINLRLYPAQENGKFNASGHIGGSDASVYNELLTPLGLATIESGHVTSCDFNLNGNDYGATGTVKMLYNDLKVKLLEKDPADGKYKSKKFASFLANAAIRDENPKNKKPARIATVNYKRNPSKGFFNLVWKSVFAGAAQTIGIEAKEPAN